MDNNVLVPAQQALVPFYGSNLLAVRLLDGRIAVSLNSLCKMLNLAKHGQMERIRRDEGLTEYLLLIRMETAGGPQRMDALIAEAIPSWVMGIQDKLIAPEKRPLIRSLKIEVVVVLYTYFFAEQAAPQAPEREPEPLPRPAGDTSTGSRRGAAPGAPLDRLLGALDEMRGAVQDLREQERTKAEQQREQAVRVEEVVDWLTSLDRRVATLSQSSAARPRSAPALSAVHRADLRTLLHLLEQTSGLDQPLLEQELRDDFGVRALDAISDDLWPRVLTWLWWRAQESAPPRLSED